MPSYKHQDFCLKADLSKAFDRMDWEYLSQLLPMYGMPPNMVKWILSCVTSAIFTVVLNGSRGGFFSPECGLRQGCSLSPYLFILGMDLLSRALHFEVTKGTLTGVKLGAKAQPLTSCAYADDLLLFGSATKTEATKVIEILYNFAAVSGQIVGPAKSMLWFSRVTGEDLRVELANIMMVPIEAKADFYLGAPILTKRGSYDFLIDKVSSKLQIWKSKILSQAGRLVVIKSVLQAMPVYYMATALLPNPVIKTLNGLIRRFYWKAGDKVHYMAFISWDTITKPLNLGGLAVRDMGLVNQAMVLKSLWKIASGGECLWIDQVNAKYLPRSLLWTSKRSYNCSTFWKNIMALRDKLLPLVQWNVGNGCSITVFGQPWFPGALNFSPPSYSSSKLTLNEITMGDGTWNGDKLIDFFGHQGCMQILSSTAAPSPQAGKDQLVFSLSPNGVYSVKRTYNHLRSQSLGPALGYKDLWKAIWKKGKVAQRVRHFVWRLVSNGLPLAKTLSSRLSKGDPTCLSCLCQEEDPKHMILTCSFARMCWFVGPLALKTEEIPADHDLQSVFLNLMKQLTDEEWTRMLNSCWAIWRSRNDMAYNGIQSSVTQFHKYLKLITFESDILSSQKISNFTLGTVQTRGESQVQSEHGYQCWVDGSWLDHWRGGIGILLVKKGELQTAKSIGVKACAAIHAEAIALLHAVQLAIDNGITSCVFYTDSQTLLEATMAWQPPLQVDWRVFKEIFELWKIFKKNKQFLCHHINRSHNEMADLLARKGTKENWNFEGFTYPIFSFAVD